MLLSAALDRFPFLALADPRRLAAALAYALLWFVVHALGQDVAASAGLAWHAPSAGLSLGLLLLYGPRFWPLPVLAGLLASWLDPQRAGLAELVLGPACTLLYAAYAALLHRRHELPDFGSTPPVGRFLLTLPLLALAPALLGPLLAPPLAGQGLAQLAFGHWLGALASLVILSPSFLLLAPRLSAASEAWRRPRPGSPRWLMATLAGAAMLFVLAFNPELTNPAWQVSAVALVLFLAMLTAGLASGVIGTAATSTLLSLLLLELLEPAGWNAIAPQLLVLAMTSGVAGLLYGVALTSFRQLHQDLERTVAERTVEARRRELSFRVLAEGSADVIALYSEHRRLLYLSPAVRELTGYSAEDIRRSLSFRKSLVHPDDWPRLAALFRTLGHGEPHHAVQYRLRQRNGDWVWLESRARVAGHEGLDLPHIVITTRDISATKQAEDHWRSLAHHDALTGCLNRRGFEDGALDELWRAHRYLRPLSLLMIDLDHFKQINDRHGHDVGDAVLHHFAELIQERCRRSEKFARLGGEEFAVLMPETGREAAMDFGERIRQLIAETPLLHVNGAIAYTVSLGLAELRPDDDLERLKKRADAALYLAKADGRNRLLLAE